MMKPETQNTSFGSITVDGTVYDRDIVIDLEGRIRKRNKKLSKRLYGTSHIISLAEAKDIFQQGARRLIIGTGQYDQVRLSEEAKTFFEEQDVHLDLASTPEAIKAWNESGEKTLGLFHVTC